MSTFARVTATPARALAFYAPPRASLTTPGLTAPKRLVLQARRGFGSSQRIHESQGGGASSSSGSSSSHGAPGGYGAVAGGIAGGAVALIIGYTWYRVSGAKSALESVRSAKQYMETAKSKMTESAPEPDQALSWLRQTAQSYAMLVPGGKAYVDAVLKDLDTIHEKHGGEVEAVVSDTYDRVKQITKSKGLTQDSAYECIKVIENALERLASLAKDSGKQILDNHPQLKKYVGDDFEELQRIGERWGPEAKEQVEKTWEQVQSIMSGSGLGPDSINKVRDLVNDKKEKLTKIRDEVFDKGLEKAKPYLDKSPKAKELIETNKEALKQGDMATLWEKVKSATSSGSIGDLESFVKSTVDDVKKGVSPGSSYSSSTSSSSSLSDSSGLGQLSQYLKFIPGAEELTDKLQQLEKIKQKYGDEAESLVKSTVEEMTQVLEKKVNEAEELGKKASGGRNA